jgi:hypothetical protein
MNIFIIDKNPVKAAQLQCDKHVNKMVLESAQMLSTAHRVLDGVVSLRPSKSGKRNVKYWTLHDDRENVLYRPVHVNHPCTVWTMINSSNYQWHYEHFVALCDEYTYRYGKQHRSDMLLRSILKNLPKNIPRGLLTPQPLAMNSNPECIDRNDIVGSYRKFYQTKQHRFKMVWSKRPAPEWFTYANL